MTTAAALLFLLAAAAFIGWLVMCFLQFLAHSAIFGGLGLALADIASVVPGELGIVMMMALMAAMALSGLAMFRGWREGIKRVGLA